MKPVRYQQLIAMGTGIALATVLGWACFTFSFGGFLVKLSYDLPFVLRNMPTSEVCIVYMDEQSSQALGQPGGVWDRAVHAQLIRKLAQSGARAIFMDIVFADGRNAPETPSDLALAAAIKEAGNVYLGAALELESGSGDKDCAIIQERIILPKPIFRKAGARYGLLAFRPVDNDYTVRRMYCGTEQLPTLTWRLAADLHGPLVNTPAERAKPRWLNYYGPAGCFANINYARALSSDGTPAGYFKGKIVFIGQRSTLGTLGLAKDDFATPHTQWTRKFMSGSEVHATAFLNLLRGEWLNRVDARWELSMILGVGVLLGGWLPRLRPLRAVAAAALIVFAVTAANLIWVVYGHHWIAWLVPVVVQAPAALLANYVFEGRKRAALRKAFACYLSPAMADQIADSGFDLTPGGKKIVATVMFTDLAGFSTLSEDLHDPKELSKWLIAYYTNTTKHILAVNGTIIKYMGDCKNRHPYSSYNLRKAIYYNRVD